MAGFFEKAKVLAQSAVEKSKELTETTKLNMDSSAAEDIIKNAKAEIGNIVLNDGLLRDNAAIAELVLKIDEAKQRIAANVEKIAAIQNASKSVSAEAEPPKTEAEAESSAEEQ